MALSSCQDCGRPVSSSAAACPHCGRPAAAATRVRSADASLLWLTGPGALAGLLLALLASGDLAAVGLCLLLGCAAALPYAVCRSVGGPSAGALLGGSVLPLLAGLLLYAIAGWMLALLAAGLTWLAALLWATAAPSRSSRS